MNFEFPGKGDPRVVALSSKEHQETTSEFLPPPRILERVHNTHPGEERARLLELLNCSWDSVDIGAAYLAPICSATHTSGINIATLDTWYG